MVTVQSNQGADDVSLVLEFSTDLITWSSAPAETFSTSRTNRGDGTSTLTFQSPPGFLTGGARHFLRLRAELLE